MSKSTPLAAHQGVDTLAPICGFILFGAMINISLMDVPLLLDTVSDSSQLLRQWCRLYEFGIRMYPVLSVTTCLIYATAAAARISAGRPWRVVAAAAAVTLGMVPFTLVRMQPTIDAMFVLRDLDVVGGETASLEEVTALVVAWQWQHVVRSLFPLAGSTLGFLGASGKVAF
ncbi:hypothetical protein KJ359_002703 [Pestalotiopsis sp. 9143b]|nr:hypothetical protein KJ359_002703 [Pestalotiopsis sp. 9143b]